MTSAHALATAAPAAGGQWREALAARGGIVLLASALFVFLTLPLAMILVRSFQDKDGAFAGLANFVRYVQTPALAQSTWNTLTFALLATSIVVPLAFVFAYAIQRSCIPLKGLWRSIALLPILAPSLLAALSFIYLFGNQGLFKALLPWLGLKAVYGLPGMVLAMAFSAFPHAVMILLASLSLSDARLYEAADAMGATRLRKFLTITLPGAKYGLISAVMVVFTMAVSEFGIPKVIGGNYPVLAIDIYKQVIGQQNFQMGAVVSLVLLVPAVLAFVVDAVVQRRQKALVGARSVPYAPRPARGRDAVLLAFVLVVSAYLLLVIGMAAYGSVVKFWPYNLSFTLDHYRYGFEEAGVEHAYRNSLVMATLCAALGAAITFAGAYWVEKTRGADALRPVIRFQAMLPMAVPGDGARHRLHPVLQPPGEPAHGPLRHDGDPGRLDGRPLLLVEPPDCRHRAEAARQRVRVGVGLAQGAVLPDLPPRDGAGVPADGDRSCPLLLRQCDDHDLRRGLPLLAEDHAGLDFHPAHGRGGRARSRVGDGDADRRHVGGGYGALALRRERTAAAHAGVAAYRFEPMRPCLRARAPEPSPRSRR